MRAKQAMRLLTNIWNKNKIVREELRVRLYRACVETHLMYNASTIPATGTEIEELNIEQRKGMRTAIGIYYPAKIGNIATYERTGTEPISMRTIRMRMRWELFGKVLRGKEEDPALRVMKDYYKGQVNRPKYRGGEKTSIATIIKKKSSYVGSKPRVRRQPLGQVDTLLMINRYQKLAKMRNKEK